MKLVFKNKKISGLLTVIPAKEITFDEEIDNYDFSVSKSLKLKQIMGYNKRRVVDDSTTSSDLCIWGINHLVNNNLLDKNEIDALVLVTQSPDYFMPPTSNIIQGATGLKKDIICLDINQGCAGFIIGLIQSFLLLEQEGINKVLLLNADVLSRKVSKKDRNSNPLIGDAASVTVIEKDLSAGIINGLIKMDGTGADALIIPAGGFKQPSTQDTGKMEKDANGNIRSKDNLVMKGDEVFNFVQENVPPMIEELLYSANLSKDQIDYFMFHQPNKFMLQKLADKMNIPYAKMPNNVVENFGNSSGVTIPTAITFNLEQELLLRKYTMCLAGFGVGLTWGGLIMDIGNLKFCSTIYF